MAKKQSSPWQKGRNALIVTIVTLLIWLYAESNTLKTDEIRVKIQFLAPTSSDLYLEIRDWTLVTIKYKCAAGQIETIEKLELNPLLLEVEAEGIRDGGIKTVDLKQAIANHSELAPHGVILESVIPESVSITVHRLAEHTMPIKINADAKISFSGKPTANPNTASVLLPESLLKRFSTEYLETRLALNATQLDDSRVGTPQTQTSLEIRLPGFLMDNLPSGFLPSISPTQTEVTFTIKNQNQKWHPDPPLPVRLMLLPEQAANFNFNIDSVDEFKDVGFSVPSDRFTEIRNSDVVLYVHIKANTLRKLTGPVQETFKTSWIAPLDFIIDEAPTSVNITITSKPTSPTVNTNIRGLGIGNKTARPPSSLSVSVKDNP